MRVVVIGGGKVGYYLVKSLMQKNQVILIEKQQSICEKIAEELDISILCGDGSSLEVLADAGIGSRDIIVAATGKDEENLIICQIATLNYKVEKTIARVNNPKNSHLFKQLGVTKTVCSTEVIANMLEKSFLGE